MKCLKELPTSPIVLLWRDSRSSEPDVDLSDGEQVNAQYLGGADGGRSTIRKVAGIEFPGWDATRSGLIAEVEVAEETPTGMRIDELGVHGLHLMEDKGTMWVVVTEKHLGPATEPTLADLSKALTDIYVTDFGVHSDLDFTVHRRHPASRDLPQGLRAAGRRRRAHPLTVGRSGNWARSPIAVNLGWKLAQLLKGITPTACWTPIIPSGTPPVPGL